MTIYIFASISDPLSKTPIYADNLLHEYMGITWHLPCFHCDNGNLPLSLESWIIITTPNYFV